MKPMLFLGFLWLIIDCGCSHVVSPPASHALEFKESSAIRKICGVDKGGHPVYTKYEKPVLVLNGKVNSVEIINNSSSLVLENDTAVFALDRPYSDHLGQQFLTLIIRYDRAALLNPDAFQKGDTWKITLTTDGKLVGYEKAEPSNYSKRQPRQGDDQRAK